MFDLSTQNFEITEELQVRKILEYNTNYEWVFNKNNNKYEYDLKAWKYNIYKDGRYEPIFKGYIEIEIGRGWNEFDWPNHKYQVVSFLKRKIYNFDWNTNEWKDTKNYIDKTFYLKFNNDKTNCLCLLIDDIIIYGRPSNRDQEHDKYKQSFIEVDIKDVIWGIKNCIDYINDKLQ